jgi:hypothetical protein
MTRRDRFRHWFRRPAPDDQADRLFDNYLDARASGLPAPEPDVASLPIESRDRFALLTATASQAFALDAQTMQVSPDRNQHHIWENVMSSIAPGTGERPFSGTNHGKVSTTRRVWTKPFVVVSPVLNVALILLIIGSLAYGLINVTGWMQPPTSNGDQIPALLPATGTPVSAAIDLPTAEDCTVTPLTVDEVMVIAQTNYDTIGQSPYNGAAYQQGPYPPPDAAADANGNQYSVPANQATIDAITEAHNQWVACVLANDWFRVWALISPPTVQFYIRLRLLPAFATEEETRAVLQEMKNDDTTVTALNTPTNRIFAAGASILMIDPDPSHSVQLMPGSIRVATISYDRNGLPTGRYASQLYYGWDSVKQRWVTA